MDSEIGEAWTAWQLSTEPVDRPAAETAIGELYTQIRYPTPRHVFWYDSPVRGALAALVLGAHHHPPRASLEKLLVRTRHWRQMVEEIRGELCERSKLPWERLCAETGNNLVDHYGGFIRAARQQFYGGPPAPDDRNYPDDALRRVHGTHQIWYYELDHFYKSTWLSPFDGQYSAMSRALDEERARESRPPALLEAAWNAMRLGSGYWWILQGAIVLSDRPLEMHQNQDKRLHRLDGPAVLYRDGFGRWAFDGMPVDEKWIRHPEDLTPRELSQCSPAFRKYAKECIRKLPPKPKLNPSVVLKAVIPAEATPRVELLRAHNSGSLPYFDRYLAGEYRKVWAELVALGPSVREDPYAADALAVAYETASRVTANIRTVTERLHALGYKFVERKPHVPPGPKTAAAVARLEKKTGGLPLSLRAFYEVVGEANWMGQHPSIAPPRHHHSPDPLVVYAASDALKEWIAEEQGGEPELIIAPDALHKSGDSGGGAYTVETPELRADGRFLADDDDLLFVDYLRRVFQSGGFPGYETVDERPLELAALSEGLIEF
jgi:hypothetical protein